MTRWLNVIKISCWIISSSTFAVFESCDRNGETIQIPSAEELEHKEEASANEAFPDEKEYQLPDNFPIDYEIGYVALPPEIPQQYKAYTGFMVSFNKDNHTPNYVVWELRAEETTGTFSRTDNFWQDKDLEGCPDKDYAWSTTGYQRGHMCPAADQKWSLEAMNDCFVMANMCPQEGDLNEKAWATLESKEREWAKRDGAIWIICGPVYLKGEDQQRIGNYQVRVPDAFFKVFLYYPKEGGAEGARAIAFVYPNALSPGNMESYIMTVDELESQLGYDFFPVLPDDIETELESEVSFAEWNK